VAPSVLVINRQQTPNPAAQFPLTVPPLSEHSTLVKHVPFLVLDPEVCWLTHGSFGNVKMLNREKAKSKIEKK
jgi:hypothetical protein